MNYRNSLYFKKNLKFFFYLPERESNRYMICIKKSLFYISKTICIQQITLVKADIFS